MLLKLTLFIDYNYIFTTDGNFHARTFKWFVLLIYYFDFLLISNLGNASLDMTIRGPVYKVFTAHSSSYLPIVKLEDIYSRVFFIYH